MKHIALYYPKGSSRGRAVINECMQGIAQSDLGDKAKSYTEDTYRHPLPVDIAVLYGLSGQLMDILTDYQAKVIPTVFFDLPYWGRKHEPYPQCHRFAINGYQPTPYFRQGHTSERFQIFERTILPWQTSGDEVLVIGMSEKQTQVWGLGASYAYHGALVERIRRHTNRPIAWRPKPSCPISRDPIPGTRYANGPLAIELQRAYCMVTYRSNVAIDSLIMGVPCVVLGDHPAETMARQRLTEIEQPLYPNDRLEFCSDLAWCQGSIQELRNGWVWKQIRSQIEALCT